MITVVMGKLGSGKSYDTVRLMLEHVNRGGAVRTNISLDFDQVRKGLHRALHSWQIGKVTQDTDPRDIPTGDRRGHGRRRTMVVLDEALNWFASDAHDTKERKATWGEWLRQSDKLGQDVFFIAQDFNRAAKWIRELAQCVVQIVPFKSMRICWFIPLWWFCPWLRSTYVRKIIDARSGAISGIEVHRYSSSVWQYYDTSETFGFIGASSAYAGDVAPAFNPPFWPLVLALVIFIVSFIF